MSNITLHDLVADAAAVIEAIGGKPVTVVGHAFVQRWAALSPRINPSGLRQ